MHKDLEDLKEFKVSKGFKELLEFRVPLDLRAYRVHKDLEDLKDLLVFKVLKEYKVLKDLDHKETLDHKVVKAIKEDRVLQET